MKVKLPYAWNIHFYCPSIKETQHTTLINENLNIPIKVRQLIENNSVLPTNCVITKETDTIMSKYIKVYGCMVGQW